MWLDNLKELKKSKGMTSKQISDITKIPESTIKRIFAGETTDPYVTTIHRIVIALGGSLDHILADTNVVLSPATLVEVKENANVVEAERDLIIAENTILKAENAALSAKVAMLEKDIQHKDELLALHNYYKKLITKD